MTDETKNPSLAADDEEEKTSVETIDAKKAEAEQRASERPAPKSEPPNDASEDDEDDAPDSEPPPSSDPKASSAPSEPPPSSRPAPASNPPSHAPSAHAAEDHHGFAHVMSVKLLVGVLVVLLVLTGATVGVTAVDLGSQWNLVVAMVIATIKAGLVVTFFMHLLWDKKFNLLAFLTSVLFLILFLGLAIADRKEYQHDIDNHQADLAAKAAAK